MKDIYTRAWFVPVALAGAFLLAFVFYKALGAWFGNTLTLETYTLLLFVAGMGAGAGITLLAIEARDMPWMIHRLYRDLRYHERRSSNDYPPSLRAYFKADRDDRATAR